MSTLRGRLRSSRGSSATRASGPGRALSIAADRLTYPGPWIRPDGVLVASDVADLTDGSLFAPINVDRYGAYWGTSLLALELGIQERELGPRHPEVAKALQPGGNALRALDRLDEAKEILATKPLPSPTAGR